jgi:hypothetical protein
MANASFDDDDDKPLDPALARVQARLKRLILISGATLAVGILAVFAAILYRIAAYDSSRSPAPAAFQAGRPTAVLSAADMDLPAGASLVSTAIDGERLVLTYAHAGRHTLVVIDLDRMAVTRKLELGE